jgi:hypothetical protein
MKDFYHILGLDPLCTKTEIAEAYLKLSEKFHPDQNPGDRYFEGRFSEINKAYQTLNDPEKRREFDEVRSISPTNPHVAYARQYRIKRGKIRRRRISIGLTLILILVAAIFGVYLFKYLFKSKQTAKGYVVQTVPVVHRRHRHRHFPAHSVLAAQLSPNLTRKINNAATAVSARPTIAVPAPALINPAIVKTNPDSSIVTTHKDFLYATYVHPNVTGIVPMRSKNNFGSTIIASIPAHKKVLVLERGATYYRVFYANTIGFVPRWSLVDK